jgi:hypothetical protein
MFKCEKDEYLLSNDDGVIVEKRIDLGQINFEGDVLKQVSNSDTIYTIKEKRNGFFKLTYNLDEIKKEKESDCKVKGNSTKNIITPRKGDLVLYLIYINPTNGISETTKKDIPMAK